MRLCPQCRNNDTLLAAFNNNECKVCNGTGIVDVPEQTPTRLDRYVCAALTGLLLRNVDGDEKDHARWAVEYAKAALEAADKEGG